MEPEASYIRIKPLIILYLQTFKNFFYRHRSIQQEQANTVNFLMLHGQHVQILSMMTQSPKLLMFKRQKCMSVNNQVVLAS